MNENRTEIVIRKAVTAFIIVILAVTVLILCAVLFYKRSYGTFSIPSWARPTHKAQSPVEDYHSPLDFPKAEEGQLPGVFITLDEDYLLSRDEYTDCIVEIRDAEVYDLESSAAKIRIRGNSTSHADKKPYKIKFGEKTSLFGGGKEKSWVLLANVNDITGIHNYVSMKIYRYLAGEDPFVPMVQFVNLFINGAYQGVYNLCDQVETGKTRVPISGKIGPTPESTDYLILHDKYAYYEENAGEEGVGWFWMDKSITPIEIKSPDTEDKAYTKEYTDYIKKRLDDIYDVILTKDWEAIQEVIDVDAIINGFMVSIIAGNADIAFKSIYYYLPAGGKLTYGPVWDMDLTFGAGTSKGYKDVLKEKSDHNAIWMQLMKVPEFKAAFTERYKEIYSVIGDFIDEQIDEAVAIAGRELENEFNVRSAWGRYGTEEYKSAQTYDEAVFFMKEWLRERLDYLYSMYCK